jgi:hypothetical protein
MSYSVPGPKRDNYWVMRIVPPPAERAASAPKFPVKSDRVQAAGMSGPPIEHLARVNEERMAALRAQDEQLARASLREVVTDLTFLLDSATRHVWQSGGKHTSKQVKEIITRDIAASVAAELPLLEVADLLDLPREQVAAALQSLCAQGAMDAASRDVALEQIRLLRAQLQLVVATEDHSLLDRLVAFIVKITHALAVAAAAATAGTLVVGGTPVSAVVVKALIIALVTKALQEAGKVIQDKRSTGNPYPAVREALADLTAELASFTITPATEPAYTHERPVLQIRLLVKTFKTQQALISTEWDGKVLCWEVLAELAHDIGRLSDSNASELGQVLRKLRAVQGQVPTC